MRPMRFEPFLRDLLMQDGQVKDVQTVSDASYTRHPYGLIVTYQTGARALLQIVATGRPGDKYDETEDIVHGDAPEPVAVPDVIDGGKVQMASADRHILALILNSGNAEISRGEAYSTREGASTVPYGATIDFHDTSRIYVYVVQALPAGRDQWPSGGEFQVPAAV